MIDIHTHTLFSPDGISPIEDMIAKAISLGLTYYGISEHIDFEYTYYGLPVFMADYINYFKAIEVLKTRFKDQIILLKGVEYGFGKEDEICEKYRAMTLEYKPDFIINSIHVANTEDCYNAPYFKNKTRREAYSLYFEEVLSSIDANFDYDIIGHLGYVSRKAPYENNKIIYDEWQDYYDEILKKIINSGKCLEINTSPRNAKTPYLPYKDILKRYKELGGEDISFGSDAHETSKICNSFDLVSSDVLALGFKYFTVFEKRQAIKIKI